jgi:hypothetical protein
MIYPGRSTVESILFDPFSVLLVQRHSGPGRSTVEAILFDRPYKIGRHVVTRSSASSSDLCHLRLTFTVFVFSGGRACACTRALAGPAGAAVAVLAVRGWRLVYAGGGAGGGGRCAVAACAAVLSGRGGLC